MSRRAHIQAIQSHRPQPLREAGLHLALAAPELELCSSLSTSSPRHSFFASQNTDANGEKTAWFTLCLLLQPDRRRRELTVPSLSGCAGIPNAIQPFMQVFPNSAISPRIFPAHPRSLALVLIPRPAALAVLLRTATPAGQVRTCREARQNVRPSGLGFQTKISRATDARRRPRVRARFFFGASAESTSSTLGAGHLASLRARVSRGHPGKYKQGETRWHSTKTTSS